LLEHDIEENGTNCKAYEVNYFIKPPKNHKLNITEDIKVVTCVDTKLYDHTNKYVEPAASSDTYTAPGAPVLSSDTYVAPGASKLIEFNKKNTDSFDEVVEEGGNGVLGSYQKWRKELKRVLYIVLRTPWIYP